MRKIDTEVLVVGAGPAGMTASILLARQGIDALTIARHPGTAHVPRAHITNQRTVEIFRELGIEDQVMAVATPLASLGHNVMATTLAGMELARYRCYGTGARVADYAAASPCEMVNVPQHILEPVLLAEAEGRGARVSFNHELVDLEQDEEGVTSRVLERDAGEEYLVRSRYLIGADGGRSQVARTLGFEFEGEAGMRHMVNVWIEVDLGQYTSHRPGVIYQLSQPGNESPVGSGSFICVRPWDEWMLMREYDPGAGELDTSDEASIVAARSLIGDPQAEVRVKGVSIWEVNHVVASEYRRGRAFLAGDAAHRHPPTGGLGSNTSIQDAYNLAWKLAFVIRGQAGEGLLASYDEERQPVGRQVVDRAIHNMENQLAISRALRLRRGQSPEEGWASLRELFSDDEGADTRRAEFAAAVKLQDYRSNANGVDLGQRYISQAVVKDGEPLPEPKRDPELHYEPTTHPGAYLPHAWVECDKRRISTLDLAGGDAFSLFVGIGGKPWAEAAARVSAEFGIEITVREIGLRCENDDVVGDWEAVREVGDRGAILVRPDRYIAWRSRERPNAPERELASAVREVLALPVPAMTSEVHPGP